MKSAQPLGVRCNACLRRCINPNANTAIAVDEDEVDVWNIEDSFRYIHNALEDHLAGRKRQHVESARSFLPRVLQRPLVNKTSEVVVHQCSGCIVFSDASGFTKLTETLAQKADGAEVLSKCLNKFFTPLIEIIEAYRGDVIKFSGDALSIMFEATDDYQLHESPCGSPDAPVKTPLQLSCLRASACCLEIHKRLHNFDTGEGGVTLTLHIGVGAGRITILQVGGEQGRFEYIIAGTPMEQIAIAEPLAGSGETVLSPQTWLEVSSMVIEGASLESEGPGFHRLKALDTAQHTYPTVKATALECSRIEALRTETMMATELLQHSERFIPRAILKHLRSGNTSSINEMRSVTIIFAQIGGVDVSTVSGSQVAQQLMLNMQRACYCHEGNLNKMLVDDKGLLFVFVFGLPPLMHIDDPTRAIITCFDMVDVLRKMGLCGRFGITTGRVFCGIVGSDVRREYTVMGDTVNLSARLMAKADENSVLIDESTCLRSQTEVICEKLEPIKVKGKANLIQIFKPMPPAVHGLRVKELQSLMNQRSWGKQRTELQSTSGKPAVSSTEPSSGAVVSSSDASGEPQPQTSPRARTGGEPQVELPWRASSRRLGGTSPLLELTRWKELQQLDQWMAGAVGSGAHGLLKNGGCLEVLGGSGSGKQELAEHLVSEALGAGLLPLFGTMRTRHAERGRAVAELVQNCIIALHRQKSLNGTSTDEMDAAAILREVLPRDERHDAVLGYLGFEGFEASGEGSEDEVERVLAEIAVVLVKAVAERQGVLVLLRIRRGTDLFDGLEEKEEGRTFWSLSAQLAELADDREDKILQGETSRYPILVATMARERERTGGPILRGSMYSAAHPRFVVNPGSSKAEGLGGGDSPTNAVQSAPSRDPRRPSWQKTREMFMAPLTEDAAVEYMCLVLGLATTNGGSLVKRRLREFAMAVSISVPTYILECLQHLNTYKYVQVAGGECSINVQDLNTVNIAEWVHTSMVGGTISQLERLGSVKNHIMKCATVFEGPFSPLDLAAANRVLFGRIPRMLAFHDQAKLISSCQSLETAGFLKRVYATAPGDKAPVSLPRWAISTSLFRKVAGSMLLNSQRLLIKRAVLIDRALNVEIPKRMNPGRIPENRGKRVEAEEVERRTSLSQPVQNATGTTMPDNVSEDGNGAGRTSELGRESTRDAEEDRPDLPAHDASSEPTVEPVLALVAPVDSDQAPCRSASDQAQAPTTRSEDLKESISNSAVDVESLDAEEDIATVSQVIPSRVDDASAEAILAKLYSACALGNTKGMLSDVLNSQSVNVNTPCEDTGNTLLHYACSSGDAEIAKILCEHGAIVDARNATGETPVLVAAQRGHLEVVKYMCEVHNAHVLGDQDNLNFWKEMLPEIKHQDDIPLPLATIGTERPPGLGAVDKEALMAGRKVVLAWLAERLSPEEVAKESMKGCKPTGRDGEDPAGQAGTEEDQPEERKARVSFLTHNSSEVTDVSSLGLETKAEIAGMTIGSNVPHQGSFVFASDGPAKKLAPGATSPHRKNVSAFLQAPSRNGLIRGRVRAFLRSRIVLVVMLIALTLALYMPDVWVSAGAPSNLGIDVVLSLVMLLFLTELILLSMVESSYPCSFFFFMDCIGTVSMIFDISFFLGESATEPQTDQTSNRDLTLFRATRTARIGARAGRLSRLVKVMRFLPGLGVSNGKQRYEAEKLQQISNQLTNVLSKRVASLTILLVIVMPLFTIGLYPEADFSMQVWIEAISRRAQAAQDAPKIVEADADSNGMVSFDEFATYYSVDLVDPDHDQREAFQRWDADKSSTLNVSEQTTYAQAAVDTFHATLEEFSLFYRNKDYGPYRVCVEEPSRGVPNRICEGQVTTCCFPLDRSQFSAPKRRSFQLDVYHSTVAASFNFADPSVAEANMGIALISLVIVLMCGACLLLNYSASELAVRPLERMLTSIKKSARAVYGSVAALGADEDEDGFGEDMDGEVVLLERVVRKIATLAELSSKKNPFDEASMTDLKTEELGVLALTAGAGQSTNASGVKHGVEADEEGEEHGRYEVTVTMQWQLEEIGIAYEVLNSWDFNVLDLSEKKQEQIATWLLMNNPGSCAYTEHNVDMKRLRAFVGLVAQGYVHNCYHNFMHAVDVVHAVFRYMTLMQADRLFSMLEQFAVLTASLGHDIGHVGLNNGFLTEAQHDLAIRYNDKSPLENMHCCKLFEILAQAKVNIFACTSPEQYRDVRKNMIDIILHTDIQQHSAMVRELEVLYEMHSKVFEANTTGMITEQEIEILATSENRKLVLRVILHAADTSNPCKPWRIAHDWAHRILDECALQGDQEKKLGIPVQMLNDRDKVNRPSSQIGFIEFLITPLVVAEVKIFQAWFDNAIMLETNLRSWERLTLETTAGLSDADREKLKERVQRLCGVLMAVQPKCLQHASKHERRPRRMSIG